MQQLIDIFFKAGKLKQIKRTGWVEHKVKNPESVADHVFRVTIMCMFLAKEQSLDQDKLIKMALIHDLAESEIGDLVAEKGSKTIISKNDKAMKEEKAMKNILQNLPENQSYYGLWHEYNQQSTQEAKFLKQVDKLEMAIQAFEYKQANPKLDLDEFWINAEKHITNERLLKILHQLKKQRLF